MKENFAILTVFLCLFSTGCKLLPGRVEYFQKEVKAIPGVEAPAVQRQKQAADYLAAKTQQTKEAAIATDADSSVLVPATEAAVVAGGLSTSLGPPETPYRGPATNLAARLEKDRAQIDNRIDKAREKQAPLVGKDIVGTGLINISWFTQAGLLVGLVLLAWVGVKIYGFINPAVGAGVGLVERVSSKLAAKAFSSTAQGIEHFKETLKPGVTYTGEQVKEFLRTALQKKQDQDVQQLARKLTTK